MRAGILTFEVAVGLDVVDGGVSGVRTLGAITQDPRIERREWEDANSGQARRNAPADGALRAIRVWSLLERGIY